MLRYVFIAPYNGDPTEGFSFDVVSPFDKVELVQPDSGELYPVAPADHVYVTVECQMHTALVEPQFDEEGVAIPSNPLAASQAALLASQMDEAASILSGTYTFMGVVEYNA